MKGVFYDHPESNALIYLNDCDYIGDADQFVQWALYQYSFQDADGMVKYVACAQKAFKEAINDSQTRKYARMHLEHEAVNGDVIFELFSDIAPITSANFLKLCNAEENGYASTEVHRIVPGMYVQAGRIRECPVSEFADESFHVKHSEIGLLGMCKRSQLKHTNECQFYITLGAPLNFLDNENVVFGRVIQGMHLIEQVENLPTVNEKPVSGPVRIAECGTLTVE